MILKTILAMSFFLVGLVQGGSDWGYSHCKGPSHWINYYPICGSLIQQSPIDITAAIYEKVPYFTFTGYGEQSGVLIKNNGHTVQVDLTNSPTITGGLLSETYKAVQLHFHWGKEDAQGSEHTVEGEAYPMEMHIVHHNTKYQTLTEAVDKADGLAVLGVFLDVADIKTDDHPYNAIVDALEHVQYKGKNYTLTSFNLKSLLPSYVSHFYSYLGSLTTPPCYESVTWTVFKRPRLITQQQLEAFRRLFFNEDGYANKSMVNNFRPVQGINNRTVYRNYETDYTCHDGFQKCANTIQCVETESDWCDGISHCRDGSDEGNHCEDYSCVSDDRKCADNLQCVHDGWWCDGESDCNDGSDEGAQCANFSCVTGERKCADNLQCVYDGWLCDGESDCNDGSDEGAHCESHTCVSGDRKCADNLQCVHDRYWCDGESDCNDGSDEGSNCEVYDCISGRRKCADNLQCVKDEWWCNGKVGCNDGSDEGADCEGYSCDSADRKCADNRQCVHDRYWCDGESDCSDGSDEGSHCETHTCVSDRRKCANNLQCVKDWWWCDGESDCNDGSDEGTDCEGDV